jgi:hypothetical protein
MGGGGVGRYLAVPLIDVSSYNESWNKCDNLFVYCYIK